MFQTNDSTGLSPEAALALLRSQERAGYTNSAQISGAAAQAPVTADAGPQFVAPQYTGPSAQDMADSEFAPQLAALQKIKDAAASQYGTAFKDTGSMYEALANSQQNQATDIRNQYDATGQRVAGAYNDAMNSVSKTYSDNENQIAAILARLGLGQAASTNLGSMGSELQKAVGNLAQSRASRGAFNDQQGQNELTQNQRTADTDRLAGKNKQTDLTRNYQTIQSQNDLKGLDLQAQKNKAINDYGLSISQQQQAASAQAQDAYFKQAGLDNQQGQLELDAQKWKAQLAADNAKAAAATSAANSPQAKDAYSVLAAQAQNLYGDTKSAGEASDVITSNFQKTGSNTLAGFLKNVADASVEFPVDEQRRRAALATIWYQQLGGKLAG